MGNWKVNENKERDHEYFDAILRDYGRYFKIIAIMIVLTIGALMFIEVQLQMKIAALDYTVGAVDELQIELARMQEEELADKAGYVYAAAEPEVLADAGLSANAELIDIVVYGYCPDIPLERSLQEYMAGACDRYGVPYALGLAVADVESGFNPAAYNDNCAGLMQIHRINYESLRAQGIEPENYYGNIEAGIKILAGHIESYGGDFNKALLAYNCGVGGANKKIAAGQTESTYTEKVMARYAHWLEVLE